MGNHKLNRRETVQRPKSLLAACTLKPDDGTIAEVRKDEEGADTQK